MEAPSDPVNHIFALVPSDRVTPRPAGGYVVDLGTADDVLRLVLAAEANPGQGVRMRGDGD
jgi:hypothetical protein